MNALEATVDELLKDILSNDGGYCSRLLISIQDGIVSVSSPATAASYGVVGIGSTLQEALIDFQTSLFKENGASVFGFYNNIDWVPAMRRRKSNGIQSNS